MKRLVLFPTFLTIVFLLGACQDKEVVQNETAGCLMTQYNNVVLNYSSAGGRLQALNFPEGSYNFSYDNNGNLTEIQAFHLSATFPVTTDGVGNIIEAMDYQFTYDNQNRLVEFQKASGEVDSYRRFEYDAAGNLAKVFAKSIDPFSFDGPPAVVEIFSQGNFLYDSNPTPWRNDKILQWIVATSLLVPFEIADQAGAYSKNNVTGYSIFYGSDPETPRFTSSVSYTYNDTNVPINYSATGSAGAYNCSYGYLCGNVSGD